MTELALLPLAGASRIIYFGTPEIAVAPLEALVASGCDVRLVVTRPDVRRGRGTKTTASPVKIAAQRLGIAVSHSPNDAIALAQQDQNLLGVVVAYGELFKSDLLSAVPMVNVHFSLLPRWRGAAPVERAILAGDTKSGVCIMRVVEKLDEGEVFVRDEVQIDEMDDADSLRLKLNAVAIKLLLFTVKNGCRDGVEQSGEVAYAKKITTNDLQINWQTSAIQVVRQVRIGGAFATINRKRLKIARAKVSSIQTLGKLPGQICDLTNLSCVVATTDGAVSLIEVQPEGKAIMKVEEWMNGARLSEQSRFE